MISTSASREDYKRGQSLKGDDAWDRLKALEDNMARVFTGMEKMANAGEEA